jgi:hypothetical protein
MINGTRQLLPGRTAQQRRWATDMGLLRPFPIGSTRSLTNAWNGSIAMGGMANLAKAGFGAA